MERRAINPWKWSELFELVQGYEVTGANRALFLCGQVSIDEHGVVQHPGDLAGQTMVALDNLETMLAAAQMTLANIVTMTIYTTEIEAWRTMCQNNEPPWRRIAAAKMAHSTFGVTALALPSLMVELLATAVVA